MIGDFNIHIDIVVVGQSSFLNIRRSQYEQPIFNDVLWLVGQSDDAFTNLAEGRFLPLAVEAGEAGLAG